MRKLPIDCDVRYETEFLSSFDSNRVFDQICASCDLSEHQIIVDGKSYSSGFGKVLFADQSTIESGQIHESEGPSQYWLSELIKLRHRVEATTKRQYGVCVCIYYVDGTRGVDFHADLPTFGDLSSIASISLGQQRTFSLRAKDDHEDVVNLELGNGSLLIMGDQCQERFEHALLVDPSRTGPRINLTFRQIGWD